MRLRTLFRISLAAVLVLTALLAADDDYAAWQHFSESQQGTRALKTFARVLTAAEKLSLERGPTNALLSAKEPSDPAWSARLAQARVATDQALAELLEELTRLPPTDRAM